MERNQNNSKYHVPVMVQESLDGLNIHPDGVYVDLTFGGGGHSKAIYTQLSAKGKLIAFDQDKDAEKNTWKASNFHFISSNFSYLKNQLRFLKITEIDGILADLGVSSHQFDQLDRGFSIKGEEKLDMRMNQRDGHSALEIINHYSEDQLIDLLRKYGEIKPARRIAQKIITQRQFQSISTTKELIEVIKEVAPRHKENKFYAQIFQAFRIEVNDELNALKKMLEQTSEVLKDNGRLVVISYHSLEDRLVKNLMKRGNLNGIIEKDFYGNVLKPFTEIVRKPISPKEEEIIKNPKARSAKLRIAERNERK